MYILQKLDGSLWRTIDNDSVDDTNAVAKAVSAGAGQYRVTRDGQPVMRFDVCYVAVMNVRRFV